MRLALALVTSVIVGACVPGPAEDAPPPPPSSLSCGAVLPPAPELPATGGDEQAPPPIAGQMTEAAAKAKRLYDSERWNDAAAALVHVASGETGDDEGNRHLAFYHLAICRYRVKRFDDAAIMFAMIAKQPNHLKFNEALLWIAKLVEDHPWLVRSLRAYPESVLHRFDNAYQRELFWQLLYLSGRERFDAGAYPEASALFAKVPPQSRWHAMARDCRARARGSERL
jgi:hypothetical protein